MYNRINFKCEHCGYESIITQDTTKLYDETGKEVKFRLSCANCGHIHFMTSEEIDMFVATLR